MTRTKDVRHSHAPGEPFPGRAASVAAVPGGAGLAVDLPGPCGWAEDPRYGAALAVAVPDVGHVAREAVPGDVVEPVAVPGGAARPAVVPDAAVALPADLGGIVPEVGRAGAAAAAPQSKRTACKLH